MTGPRFGFGKKPLNPYEGLVGEYVLIGGVDSPKAVGKIKELDATGEFYIVDGLLVMLPGDREITPKGPFPMPTSAPILPITKENYDAFQENLARLFSYAGQWVLLGKECGGLVDQINTGIVTFQPCVKILPSIGWSRIEKLQVPYDSKEVIIPVDENYFKRLIEESKEELERVKKSKGIQDLEALVREKALKKRLEELEGKSRILF